LNGLRSSSTPIGAGVTILPPFISFLITCPATSSPLPHLVLTVYHLLRVLHPYKPFYKA
jgi:hypothetical protein